MKLEISDNNGVLTGILNGRLDTVASTQFANDMEPLIKNAARNIVLDCTALEFISSSGLRLFLTLKKASLAQGGSVTLKGLSPSVRQVFTITGFSSLFAFE